MPTTMKCPKCSEHCSCWTICEVDTRATPQIARLDFDIPWALGLAVPIVVEQLWSIVWCMLSWTQHMIGQLLTPCSMVQVLIAWVKVQQCFMCNVPMFQWGTFPIIIDSTVTWQGSVFFSMFRRPPTVDLLLCFIPCILVNQVEPDRALLQQHRLRYQIPFISDESVPWEKFGTQCFECK
eukprot:TRINITY_DN62301_c0_g1_i1.p1 TRINITY_DN62301_c0_g1~~TRINITY_DN62301_c0_g1_i1.p1  ORF type:complete len:180 (+),score=11.56 TRINITY_DN62301_c0_g1_i1:352-891(+)